MGWFRFDPYEADFHDWIIVGAGLGVILVVLYGLVTAGL